MLHEDYERLRTRVRSMIETLVPADATVLVVSKGDDALLELGGPRGWHFPRTPSGGYAGYHPADSVAAIGHLEDLRADGADHIVFPRTAFWWLEHYAGLHDHLREHYRAVLAHEDCLVFSLGEPAAAATPRPASSGQRKAPRPELERVAASLLPAGSVVAVLNAGRETMSESLQAQLDLRELETADVTTPQHGGALLARRGAEFLLIPSTAYEWLDSRPDVRRALTEELVFVTRQRNVCEVYAAR
jgi:hypothetical protein